MDSNGRWRLRLMKFKILISQKNKTDFRRGLIGPSGQTIYQESLKNGYSGSLSDFFQSMSVDVQIADNIDDFISYINI